MPELSWQQAVTDYGKAAAGYAHSGEQLPMDRMHAATGIQEEAIELVEVVSRIWDHGGRVDNPSLVRNELQAEMGGCLWYVNYAAHVYGHTLMDVAGRILDPDDMPIRSLMNYRDLTVPLLWNAREVASYIKKEAYHGKPMVDPDELPKRLCRVWVSIARIGATYGVLATEAMLYNLAELERRHGGTSFDPTVYTEGRK